MKDEEALTIHTRIDDYAGLTCVKFVPAFIHFSLP